MNKEILKREIMNRYRTVFPRENFIQDKSYLEMLASELMEQCQRFVRWGVDDLILEAYKRHPGEKFEQQRYAFVANNLHPVCALPGNYSILKKIVLSKLESSQETKFGESQAAA